MSLTSMLSRKDPLKRAFVTLDDGMTDILKEEFLLPPEIENEIFAEANVEDNDGDGVRSGALTIQASPGDANERISPHTQDRLARYGAVDDAHTQTQDDLARIGDALANISAAHRQGRDLLNDYFADIHRANEFENANAAYAAENRRLAERVDKLERLRTRYDQLVEVLKRREGRLLAEAEELRESVATSKLEVVETQTAIARSESLNGELRAALSSRTSEAERYMRNAEMLREKNVGLTLDLELANKKQSESRRKADELAAMHASDTSRLAEIMARLSAEEHEAARLQKVADSVEAKLVDAIENVGRLTGELTEREKRYQTENGALKAEIQTLNARLQGAAGEHRDALSDASALRSRIGDLESEKQIQDQKMADLRSEVENERRINTDASQSLLEMQSGNGQDVEKLRQQVVDLQASVNRLKKVEDLYEASQKPSKVRSDVPANVSVDESAGETGRKKDAARAR